MQQRVESKGTATVNLRGLNPAMTMQVDSEISAAAPGQAAAPVMKTQMRMTITPEAL